MLFRSLRGFDLSDSRWDHGYVPDMLARVVVSCFTVTVEKNRAVGPRYNLDVDMDLGIMVTYKEPAALLLVCQQAMAARRSVSAAAGVVLHAAAEECVVCSEALDDSSADTIRLICGHEFHTPCIKEWFDKTSTCPLCRRDVADVLVAVTGVPAGTFPGVEVPPQPVPRRGASAGTRRGFASYDYN